jgi:hypothetical protein
LKPTRRWRTLTREVNPTHLVFNLRGETNTLLMDFNSGVEAKRRWRTLFRAMNKHAAGGFNLSGESNTRINSITWRSVCEMQI